MNELEVRIVELEPMRVASAHGFGESPEEIAWQKILAFADARGLMAGPDSPRFFGFNNPDPSPGSPNYGYEQWITVGTEVEPQGDIEIKSFEGGLFAVTRCHGIPNIGRMWRELVVWGEKSGHKMAHRVCLEECLTPPGTPLEDMVLDLYLPIKG